MKLRRIRSVFAVLALAVAAAAVTLPYWLAAAARPLLRAHGLEWVCHESRWRTLSLGMVTFESESIAVSAASVSLKMPAYWLFGLLRGDANPASFATVDGWTVMVADAGGQETADRHSGLEAADQAGSGWNALARWLPSALLRDGTLRLAAADGFRLDIPEAAWLRGTVRFSPGLRDGDGVLLAAADVEASMRWPEHGRLRLSLDMESMPAGLLPPSLSSVALPAKGSLLFNGGWDRGPLSFAMRLAQAFRLSDGAEAQVEASVDAGTAGMELRSFEARIEGATVMHADGRIPLVIAPGDRQDPIRLHRDAPFSLRSSMVPDTAFWTMIENMLPVRFSNAALFADIDGTLADPRGRIRLTADKAGFPVPKGLLDREPPPVTGLRMDLKFSEEYAMLERLELRIAEQAVAIKARLPLGGDAWRDMLRMGRLPHWSVLQGSLRIPKAEIGAFSEYAPTLLAPVGTVSADLNFAPGGLLYGTLDVQDAATRPVMPLGAISSIRGRVRFDGREMSVEELSGMIGDSEISAGGDARLRDDFAVDYTLRIAGVNIPIVRRPGLMLRGDLDLAATGSTGARSAGRIGGQVTLRKGYYLSDLRLPGVEGSVTEPSQRPPFFSVEQAPFADWTLDLAIGGDGFMQVRSPIFNGVLSADFHLGGTLREPLSPGRLAIDHGRIRFPFASLDIERGTVLLTRENPYRAQLQVTSGGRVFGYDIRMDLRGPADDPALTFSSTPPLSSEAVLMMITAGELPEREIAFTGQQRAARLALFLGQHMLYEMTGNENIGDNLVIEGGRNISRQGKETYAIRYRLSDRISLTGEYDEYDAINAGIRLRVFSR